MLSKKLQNFFLSVTFIATLFLLYNLYNSYKFRTQPIDPKIALKIHAKEREVVQKIQLYYLPSFSVPLTISDKLPSNIYGLTSLDKEGMIRVYINRKRIKESLGYILEDVIAHEYAHAVMFAKGERAYNDGHSKAWQEVCLQLGGKRCDRYVNHNDILIEKMELF